MTVTIWHNPRCSKSRETLALLQSRGIAPDIRLYQTDAPSLADLETALALLGLPARALARTGDEAFRALGLPADASDAAILKALAQNPSLIERPVVFANGKAALGRPPEAVLTIL